MLPTSVHAHTLNRDYSYYSPYGPTVNSHQTSAQVCTLCSYYGPTVNSHQTSAQLCTLYYGPAVSSHQILAHVHTTQRLMLQALLQKINGHLVFVHRQ